MESEDKIYQHTLVEDENTLITAISKIKCGLKSKKLISVDCKGDDPERISRIHGLSILSIATLEKVFLFDVHKLKKTMFEKGLGDILEDGSIQKLMFDCKQSSDCLWHMFGVRLTGVLDLQLLEVMYRRDESQTSTMSKHIRRSRNVNDVEKVYEYDKCLKIYVKDEDLIKMKRPSFIYMYLGPYFPQWKARPLSCTEIKVCCVDVQGLFRLYENLKRNDKYLERLSAASERYADRFRSLQELKYNEYEINEYLPLDIIPNEGMIIFPKGDTACVTCHRLFPTEEFSFTQLRKGIQKCRVCKKVKEQLDKEKEWEKIEESYAEYCDEDEEYNFNEDALFWL